MPDRVARYAPESPSWRFAFGFLLCVSGLAAGVLGLYEFLNAVLNAGYILSPMALVLVLLGGPAAAVGGHLLAGIVRQAEAASPEANPTRSVDDEMPEDDPIDVLKKRYARGELNEEEFDRRVERLLESDRHYRTVAGERLTEESVE